MNTLLVNNYDSFTYNLEHLLVTTLEIEPQVVDYHMLPTTPVSAYDLVVISPGPRRPRDYPDYASVLDSGVPVLGICLGMQIINEHFGGTTGRLTRCIHGRTDRVQFDGATATVARYHSLAVTRVGEGLQVIGVNPDGVPMALRHLTRPLIGYQFHPESFLTPNGERYIEYALQALGLDQPDSVSVDRR